jgi:branched-chain amino acid transport system ATP-binding protein
MLLEVTNLTKNFGGLAAVSQFNMKIPQGQIVGLIGPNGAGKSTIFNLITGMISPTTGKVVFAGKDITRKSPHQISAMGIGWTFQLTPLFADFTTLENVVASLYLHPHSGFWSTLFNTTGYRRNEAIVMEKSLTILDLVGLSRVKNECAKNLSHGYQKMLGIARALAVEPRLLMLDEPLGGMNTDEMTFTMDIMSRMKKQGMTILVIEHNMQILDLCDQVEAINFGQNICSGCVDEVKNHPEVIKAYLGEQDSDAGGLETTGGPEAGGGRDAA